jgi:hypothetical protein
MIKLAGYVPDEQIKIEFIGERPGEKLYEEVFSLNEKLQETHHEKILISKERIRDNYEVEEIILSLKRLENHYDLELFKLTIKKLLPEFKCTKENLVLEKS